MGFKVESLDHLVLTVDSVERSVRWYVEVLGMEAVEFDGRWAVKFGNQKINFHQKGKELKPGALKVQVGSGDLCFLTGSDVRDYQGAELGPVERTGATGKLLSVYLRDPDGNLIEVSNLLS